jgi:hypothetical protein
MPNAAPLLSGHNLSVGEFLVGIRLGKYDPRVKPGYSTRR